MIRANEEAFAPIPLPALPLFQLVSRAPERFQKELGDGAGESVPATHRGPPFQKLRLNRYDILMKNVRPLRRNPGSMRFVKGPKPL